MDCNGSVNALDPSTQGQSSTLVIPNNFEQEWNELIRFKNDMYEIKSDIKDVIQAYKQGYYNGNTEVIEVIQADGITIREFNDDIKPTTIKLRLWCKNY